MVQTDLSKPAEYGCTCCHADFTVVGPGHCCPYTQYYKVADEICDHCHGTCVSCSGPAETECTGCFPHMSHDKATGTCVWDFTEKLYNCAEGYTLL
jgi:hypothetical protein